MLCFESNRWETRNIVLESVCKTLHLSRPTSSIQDEVFIHWAFILAFLEANAIKRCRIARTFMLARWTWRFRVRMMLAYGEIYGHNALHLHMKLTENWLLMTIKGALDTLGTLKFLHPSQVDSSSFARVSNILMPRDVVPFVTHSAKRQNLFCSYILRYF